MNIIEILWDLGYQIISINNKNYKVVASSSRILQQGANGGLKSGEVYDICIKEVGFNNLGNLYVEFVEVENTNEIFDFYEYERICKYE